MQTPNARELRTAIKVLTQLHERLQIEAAYSILQLPKTQLGERYAGDIGMQALEQTARIENVCAELANWRAELPEAATQRSGRTVIVGKKFEQFKNAVSEGWRNLKTEFQKICHAARNFSKRTPARR